MIMVKTTLWFAGAVLFIALVVAAGHSPPTSTPPVPEYTANDLRWYAQIIRDEGFTCDAAVFGYAQPQSAYGLPSYIRCSNGVRYTVTIRTDLTAMVTPL